MTESIEKESESRRWIAFFAAAVAFVVVTWLVFWALITWKLGSPVQPGAFGDMFGAVNALFSGLAFAGIIVAILLQRQELQYQRDELRLTRGEMGRSTEAQEQQVRALRVAAVLNARTTLIEVYGSEPGAGPYGRFNQSGFEQQIKLLENQLQDLDESRSDER